MEVFREVVLFGQTTFLGYAHTPSSGWKAIEFLMVVEVDNDFESSL